MKYTLACLVLCLNNFLGSANAQQFPFPFTVLSEEPPYYSVRYAGSENPNELVFAVNYTVWIPPGSVKLRSLIVHQHGCGRGAAYTGLTGAFDLHWQALAKKHNAALISTAYEQSSDKECSDWAEPRQGSNSVFLKALSDLATKTGHPELASVPWALWGHSGGAYWVGAMAFLHPERVAAVWMRSGAMSVKQNAEQSSSLAYEITAKVLNIPMMLNQGAKEGISDTEGRFARIWPRNKSIFLAIRAKGGLIAHSSDLLSEHNNGNQRYLAIPWFNAILEARLPQNGKSSLQNMPLKDAWLAPLLGTKAVAANQYIDKPTEAVWLPNQAIAQAWMTYMTDNSVADHTPPPAPTNVVMNLGKNGIKLTWDSEADLESGLAHFIIERDGEYLAKILGSDVAMKGRQTFQTLYNSDSPRQPLPEMMYIDSTASKGKSHKYKVISVNTVGLKSN